MNLLHFIIFIVVLYYCAYVLDFFFSFFFFLLTVVNYCGRTPLGALIKSFIQTILICSVLIMHFIFLLCNEIQTGFVFHKV